MYKSILQHIYMQNLVCKHIQDVAMKQGNINADVDLLANSKKNNGFSMFRYGRWWYFHPRDNIALRHMAQKLDLGYDLFDSIMNARENKQKYGILVAKAKELT